MPHPLRSFNIPPGAQFGARRLSGRGHAGTDYHPKSNKDGDPIYGTLDGGRISAKGYGPSPVNGFGHWVKIAYPGGVETTSAHMREPSPWPVGTAVGPSTVIGYVGHTGNAVIADPPGSHVHHELRVNGVLRDPFAYYGGASAPATAAAAAITPTPPTIQGDTVIYIQCNAYPTGTKQGPTGPFAGATYRRDERTGAWRACTNIETEAIVPNLVTRGLAAVYPFNPADLELLFAVDGLLEQTALPASPPTWGGGKKLTGLGAPTGRIIFPGSETLPRAEGLPARGKWHAV
jgi:murein DD-endopeptidase MepM/ murein hydrolase activator NlpD